MRATIELILEVLDLMDPSSDLCKAYGVIAPPPTARERQITAARRMARESLRVAPPQRGTLPPSQWAEYLRSLAATLPETDGPTLRAIAEDIEKRSVMVAAGRAGDALRCTKCGGPMRGGYCTNCLLASDQ